MTEIAEQIQAYNKDLNKWTDRFENRIRSSIRSLSQKGKGELLRSLRGNVYKRDGEIDRIGFDFEKHGVFWQKGVGHGYVMLNGIVRRGQKVPVARNRNIHDKRTDFRAQSGLINRRPEDWFNGPLNTSIENLASLVAEHYADRTVNATRMQIR